MIHDEQHFSLYFFLLLLSDVSLADHAAEAARERRRAQRDEQEAAHDGIPQVVLEIVPAPLRVAAARGAHRLPDDVKDADDDVKGHQGIVAQYLLDARDAPALRVGDGALHDRPGDVRFFDGRRRIRLGLVVEHARLHEGGGVRVALRLVRYLRAYVQRRHHVDDAQQRVEEHPVRGRNASLVAISSSAPRHSREDDGGEVESHGDGEVQAEWGSAQLGDLPGGEATHTEG
mmetsp:Transcript_43928/g.93501  ORF Transcript_43928/g.93501 Transcript_43928/m.93501 type:complete len:231 (+) Transcript_43928:67-759(+)